jgi:phage terminase large subunit-like protein
MEFVENTKKHNYCAIVSGNRTGKTTLVRAILAQWITGIYFPWYDGYKFSRSLTIMCLCDTNQNLRDVWSEPLIGHKQKDGSFSGGFIPAENIVSVTFRASTGGLVDKAIIKNSYGSHSTLYFRCYQQDREAFQGYTLDVVCFDEEPKQAIYGEIMTRLMTAASTKDSKVLISYTPLKGMGELVMQIENEFKLPESQKSMGTTRVSMYEVPHISKEIIEMSKKRWPRLEWDARIYGIPSAGQGMIFSIPDDDISVDPFAIPQSWPRFMGFDYGYNRTAAVYCTIDPNTKIIYVYDTLILKEKSPAEHYMALRQKGGLWIPGASETALIMDSGQKRLEHYIGLGLNLFPAVKAKQRDCLLANLDILYEMFLNGEIKVFKTLSDFFAEKAVYHLTEKMKITDLAHDLMDAFRYAVIDGKDYADVNPEYMQYEDVDYCSYVDSQTANPVTGY